MSQLVQNASELYCLLDKKTMSQFQKSGHLKKTWSLKKKKPGHNFKRRISLNRKRVRFILAENGLSDTNKRVSLDLWRPGGEWLHQRLLHLGLQIGRWEEIYRSPGKLKTQYYVQFVNHYIYQAKNTKEGSEQKYLLAP